MCYKYPKFLLLLMSFALVGSILTACNNNNSVSPAGSTTQIVVINAIPDIGPLALLLDNVQLGGTTAAVASRTYFRYSATPAYYSIKSQDSIVFQLQAYPIKSITKLGTIRSTRPNTGYTLFLTGLSSVDSLSSVFTTDTAALPSLGRGKIRFINASPRTPELNVSINGSPGFSKIGFTKVSNYVEVPAGTYEFKLTANNAPATLINTLSRVTILDGKLYTLYTKGLVGRTDSAAIGLNVFTNVNALILK